jgi:mRNA interferase RelE/StbE
MDTYRIDWKPSALKELKKIDRQIIPRVVQTVEGLASNPFPAGVRKIQGGKYSYRIRIGDYRIIYQIFETRLIIEIIRIRHRKDA